MLNHVCIATRENDHSAFELTQQLREKQTLTEVYKVITKEIV
jgi:hypothetical protein